MYAKIQSLKQSLKDKILLNLPKSVFIALVLHTIPLPQYIPSQDKILNLFRKRILALLKMDYCTFKEYFFQVEYYRIN